MALRVKDASASAQKFVSRAQGAAADYTKGVTGAGAYWQSQTVASNDAYVQGVTVAANAGRFAKGVAAAGGAKYESGATTKGASHYPTGVSSAGPAWQAGFQKFQQVLSGLNLPPRSARGNPANQQRSTMVQQALHNAKVGS